MTFDNLGLATAAVVLSINCSASAQIGLGSVETTTQSTTYQPVFKDGRLLACEYAFEANQIEFRHLGGEPVLLSGSLLVIQLPGKAPALIEKLAIGHLDHQDQRLEWIKPAGLGLQNGLTTNQADLLGASAGDTPGSWMSTFALGETTSKMLIEAFEAHRLSGYFTLDQGGIASNFDVDMRVADQASRGTDTGPVAAARQVADLSQCISTLVSHAK